MKKPSYTHVKSGRLRTAVHGVSWSLLNSFMPSVVSAIVFMFASRILLPADFGLVTFAVAVVMTISYLAPQGFGDSLIQKPDISDSHINSVFWLTAIFAIFLYAVSIIFTFSFGRNVKGFSMLVPIIGVRIIFDMLIIVPNSLLARSMSFKKLAMRTSIASLVAAAICILLLINGFGLWALVASQVTTSIVACAAAWLSIDWRPSTIFDNQALKEVSSYGIFATLARAINSVSVDQIVIGVVMGSISVGYYGFAKRIYQIINELLSGALNSVSYSILSSLQDEKEKLRTAFLTSTFIASSLAFPLFGGLVVTAPDFVPLLFGSQWTAAVPVVQWMCALGLIACIGILQGSLIKSQGRADWWMWYQLFQQTSNAVLILSLHRYGLNIVAAGLVIKNVVAWPATVWCTSKLIGVPVTHYVKRFLPGILATIFMVAIVLYAQNFMKDSSPVLRLVLEVLFGGVTYLLLFSILARHDLRPTLEFAKAYRKK